MTGVILDFLSITYEILYNILNFERKRILKTLQKWDFMKILKIKFWA